MTHIFQLLHPVLLTGYGVIALVELSAHILHLPAAAHQLGPRVVQLRLELNIKHFKITFFSPLN